MNASSDRQPSESRPGIRMGARLDATTRAKVDDLAKHFHKPRATVVCHIMRWGLIQGRAKLRDAEGSEGPVRHLYCYVESELHQLVQRTATVAGMHMAPWLRTMVRQITMPDFPPSWQAEHSEERSHDSHTYRTRFMLRLDETAEHKPQQLISHFGASKAAIRQLIRQATLEDVPKSWQMRAQECAA